MNQLSRTPASTISAVRDETLAATVIGRMPLYYTAGPAPVLDRPAHVRAGSSLAWFGARLAVVQDDASFVALIDPALGRVDALPLPAGNDGARQFDDARGNKRDKPDWEACAVVPSSAGETLWLFGSGSSGRREFIALVQSGGGIEMFEASAFYGDLRAQRAFSGSELNVEGAVYRDGRICLFNRGNGARRDDQGPVNASCDIDAAALEVHLRTPGSVYPPRLERIVAYDLGAIEGACLTFTDAAVAERGTYYLATAEDSADAVSDGAVSGSAIGIIGSRGCRWVELREADGTLSQIKTEGIAMAPGRGEILYVVVDADDPAQPSELCEVRLAGAW